MKRVKCVILKKISKNVIKRIILSVLIYIIGALCLCAVITLQDIMIFLFHMPVSPIFCAIYEILIIFFIVCLVSLIYGLIFKQKKSELLKRLTTFPDKGNYIWQGGFSAVTFLILLLTMLFRVVSCLQLCKLIYRKALSNNKDFRAKRPNVSPLFQEVYFIFWAIFLITQHYYGNKGSIVDGLCVYFIIESFTWILYYSVLRRFFEENYSIYHVLEHLPIILILIPMQAVAYAELYSEDNTWEKTLEVLLGQANEHFVLFSIIGFIYSAIVVSMILSMFPIENVKPGNPETIILGAGDVVKNRLLPALLKRELKLPEHNRGSITIYDKKTNVIFSDWDEIKDDWAKLGFSEEKTRSVYSLIEKKMSKGDKVAWICTPSNTHWYYMDILLEKANFIAVEKPIASNMKDLICFEEFVTDAARERVFFLSYYLLDKALPLTFLCRPRKMYLSYLVGCEVDKDKVVYPEEKMEKKSKKEVIKESNKIIEDFYQRYIEAGKVCSFKMEILEGEDNRPLPEGGQWIDTFIHNVIIASMFLGIPTTWGEIKWESVEENNIELRAIAADGASIHLKVEKNNEYSGNNRKQTARIEFEDKSSFSADFINKELIYSNENKNKNKRIALAVSQKYKAKYDVQCAMVYDCYANEIKASDVDGLYLQLDVLKWILENYNKRVTLAKTNTPNCQ